MDTRDDDDRQQRRWDGGLRDEYGRIFSRLESKLDQHGEILARMAERGEHRDQKQKEIQERQQQDAHNANNVAQNFSARIEKLQVSSDTVNKRVEQVTVQVEGVSQQVAAIESRVGGLEAPIKEGLIARERRWAKFRRWGGWLAAVGAVLWAIAEPAWRGIAPLFLQRFFSGGPPP